MPRLISQIVSDAILDQAYAGLCKRREHCHYNDDVWRLRFHWPAEKALIQEQLLQGNYDFSPCCSVPTRQGWTGRWNGRDALVLKAMSLVLSEHLAGKISTHCYHMAGHGGAKACVQALVEQVEQYYYVCRSDVNSYYASIDHNILRKQLANLIDDACMLRLIDRMLARLDDVDAELFTVEKGITKGNPLSPLLGAVYLSGLDEVLGGYCQKHGLFYGRFRDDWIVLCKTRNQLRTVVRLMNRLLEKVKMTKHPFKTYIGRIKTTGFDFLGYRIANQSMNGLAIAWNTWSRHRAKLKQLYEQNASTERIAEYVKRWLPTWT